SQIIVYGIIDIIQLWLNETNPRSEAEIVDILMKTRFLSPYQLLALEK
ncbi:TetR/AcrR family transcriptional regulator, partial [Lactobacillus rhamnosus]|nr:TetR/AcrR family transcriptional regulator [Lacticaseibacillus rhamnosus]